MGAALGDSFRYAEDTSEASAWSIMLANYTAVFEPHFPRDVHQWDSDIRFSEYSRAQHSSIRSTPSHRTPITGLEEVPITNPSVATAIMDTPYLAGVTQQVINRDPQLL